MNFKEFIGIDVSKSHIDVFIRRQGIHAKFNNSEAGFKKMLAWIEKHIDCIIEEVLFAFEHTGLYSLPLSLFLHERGYKFTLLPGLELKKSMGISRGKNDKGDAKRIAEYTYEKKEKIRLYQMPSDTILKLKRLLSYRERLVKERAAFKGRLKEYSSFLDQEENSFLFASHAKMLAHFNEEIKKVEKELYRLIKTDEKLTQQFKLIKSIKGVGPQTALVMIVLTHGFTTFEQWRKFASYAGTAPFPNESGTYKGRTKISHLANKRIKTLLSCCATSAIQFNAEMRMYYQKRVAEAVPRRDKNEMSTLNIVRNKLLARIFAVVQRGTPYVDVYKFAA